MNKYLSQQSIVSKLKSDFASIGARWQALDLPDTQSEYQVAVPVETVFVVYHGSQADPSVSTMVISQPRKPGFNIDIYSKTLYNANGAYAISDIVEQSLVGFKPVNCQRLYLVKDDLGVTEDRIWMHSLQFECETMLIQKDDEDPIVIPSFQQLTDNELT